MDKGLVVANEFPQQVQTIVGPLLSSMGFDVDAIDNDVDEGGRTGSVVFYRSQDCKIQIYFSAREREINAMIGSLNAPNEHGLYTHSREWHYFNEFTDEPKLPLEQLVEKLRSERANFETTPKWLEWIKRERIMRYFKSAHAAMVEGR